MFMEIYGRNFEVFLKFADICENFLKFLLLEKDSLINFLYDFFLYIICISNSLVPCKNTLSSTDCDVKKDKSEAGC